MNLAEAIERALDAGVVRSEVLFNFKLDDGDYRVWTGFGDLFALGAIWRGSRTLGRLPELEQLINGLASRMTIEVSGVSADAVAALVEEAPLVDGRELELLRALFDVNDALIAQPYFLDVLIMDEVTDDEKRERSDSGDKVTRTIALSCATALAARGAAPHSHYNHTDQQARYPGDMGCEYVGVYENKSDNWPVS